MKTTIANIDELLAYLPRFNVSGRKFAEWSPHYPVYHSDVEEFFSLLSQEFWYGGDYIRADANNMLGNPDLIAKADLQEVKTMLTACWRGERFCYGRWEQLLESGIITMLLERLKIIREQLFA